jgi:hypothetical protein
LLLVVVVVELVLPQVNQKAAAAAVQVVCVVQ